MNTTTESKTTNEDITEPCIPISWFKEHSYMNPGQALSLWLHEKLDLGWTEGGKMIGKTETTVRKSYGVAAAKRKIYTKTHNDTQETKTHGSRETTRKQTE